MPSDGSVLAGRSDAGAGVGPSEAASAPMPAGEWSRSYLRARELEGRLYPDAIVAKLPWVPPSDPLSSEWRIRADSAMQLLRHLDGLPRPLVALEVGCGNGWLANQIAGIGGSRVLGIDANEPELAQARRVFGSRSNLEFVLADITVVTRPIDNPTVIVLASVVQYVADLAVLVRNLRAWLPPYGELHILDTPFYATVDLERARERSRRHYEALGVPEMAEIYRHHDMSVLDQFEPELLYRPRSMRARAERRLFGSHHSPFPWVRIRGTAPWEEAPA